MTSVLITGITGQDGYYLSELCHDRGYEVYGLVRGQNNPKAAGLAIERPYVKQIEGDLTDQHSLCNAFEIARPDYVFNLGAITYIPFSWQQPELVNNVNFLGVQRVLEEATLHGVKRVVQASTSEMYGDSKPIDNGRWGLDESSAMRPMSPYAIAKLAAHHLCVAYRAADKVDAVSAIMFNHESERRGDNFVTRKITLAAARIKNGIQKELSLGYTGAVRDWGYAPEYMEALLIIAEAPQCSSSYVIATGEEATVYQFLTEVWQRAGLKRDEKVFINQQASMRANDVPWLKGDASRIERELGWKARTYWNQLAARMYDHDYRGIHEYS